MTIQPDTMGEFFLQFIKQTKRFAFFQVNNLFSHAKRMYFILIPRQSAPGYQLPAQQLQFHSSMTPQDLCTESYPWKARRQ